MRKPVIGITSSYENNPERQNSYLTSVSMDYSKAVMESGGIPFVLPVHENLEVIREQIQYLDGLLLAGGGDPDPVLYGEDCLHNVGSITPERDAFELAILEKFLKTEKPILGICRGLQLANVYYGGTLYQDISYINTKIQHRQTWLQQLPTHNIDIFETDMAELQRIMRENGLEVEKADNRARVIDKLWKNIRKDVTGPVWLINTPKFISPLSKTSLEDERLTERFQPVIAGSELGNGFSELNDPIDQLERFLEQQQMREAGDDEAMMLDIDFVEMLEYGMPPTCGWGYSERVFWIFEGVTAREGVPFPQLRRGVDPVTRKIYPTVKFD